MGDRELREKYGGKLPKAINRAIRAEVPGGNEALDKLTQLAGAARHSRWKDHAGRETPEAEAYFKHKREVVDRMQAEVLRRWGVSDAKDRESSRGGRGRKGAPSDRPRRGTFAKGKPRRASRSGKTTP